MVIYFKNVVCSFVCFSKHTLSVTSMFAFSEIRSWIVLKSPLRAARCKGVRPSYQKILVVTNQLILIKNYVLNSGEPWLYVKEPRDMATSWVRCTKMMSCLITTRQIDRNIYFCKVLLFIYTVRQYMLLYTT